MSDSILIYCDDKRHARGKVAKIATYTRDEQGLWALTRDERGVWPNPNPRPRRADTSEMFRCTLCGQKAPVWAQQWTTQLSDVLDWLAAHRESDVRLADLPLVASKTEKR